MCLCADVFAHVCTCLYVYGFVTWMRREGRIQFCLLWSSPSCVSLTAVILILLLKSHNFVHQQKQKQQGNDRATQFLPLNMEKETESALVHLHLPWCYVKQLGGLSFKF